MTCIVLRAWVLVVSLLLLGGLSASAQISLVATGSTWKYLDTGVEPDLSWRTLGFDDNAWLAGPAQLGFGDGDEITQIRQLNGSEEPIVSYYFRRVLPLSNPSTFTNLLLRLRRDDGAIVYLNGIEIFRSNLPLTDITPTTLAATASDDGEELFDVGLNPQALLNGDNLLAVEIHQSSTTSSDLSFDLELLANVPFSLIPLVHRGAVWKFLDDGSDQLADWRAVGFNDAGWSNGIAQLGFGEGDEATRIRQVSTVTGTNAITYYFRHAFSVANRSQITNLVARLIRDDGAVVYLNGTEIQRINMPGEDINSMTLASQVVGNDNTFHAIQVNPGLLQQGINVLAVEMHQFNLTSSDISFDFELRLNVRPTAPLVAISSPTNTASFFSPTNLRVDVLATDYDSPLSSIAFYLSGNLQGSDSTDAYDVSGRNYSLTFSNLASGTYTVTAIATDMAGLTSTSAPVHVSIVTPPVITRLIATNATWKYLDTGVDQEIGWRAPSFNDSSWASGRAKFGTNDVAMNTFIRLRNAGGVIPTAYFRHYFSVSNISSYTNLGFRVLRDDGCIAYLNGAEIFRMNIQTGAVSFFTYVPSLQAVGSADEFTFYPTNISASFLVNGTNVLAVELHQTQSTTDASFDLELSGISAPPNGVPPLTIERSGPNLIIRWSGSGFILQDAGNPGGPYADLLNASSPFPVLAPTGNRFYRLTLP